MLKYKESFNPYIIFIVTFLVLTGFLRVPIFNEDYLVLSWMNPNNLADCFSDFVSRQTGGPYWRPVVWSSYFVTKYFVGYNGFAYHLTNLAVYSALMSLIYLFLKRIGTNANMAFISVLLFSVLPSHELIYAWIPGRTDLFMSFFMLSSILYYLNSRNNLSYKICSAFCFLLAILSKETAYAGIAVPLILLLIEKSTGKDLKMAFFASAIAFGIILLTLAYRILIIGGTPFETSNFSTFGMVDIIKNMIIYVPLSILNADLLEKFFYVAKSNIIPTIVIFLLIVVLAVKLIKFEALKSKKAITIFGLLWFSAFILPATPTLMQWYGFIASIGLFVICLAVLETIQNQKYVSIIMLGLIAIGSIYSVQRSIMWQNAGERTNYALKSLADIVPAESDSIIVLATPDKIDRINSMKIGLQQAVEQNLRRRGLTVISPLRCELTQSSKIHAVSDSSVIKFRLDQGRFVIPGRKSTSILRDETSEYTSENMVISIANSAENVSVAEIHFSSSSKIPIFYFDGSKFKRMVR